MGRERDVKDKYPRPSPGDDGDDSGEENGDDGDEELGDDGEEVQDECNGHIDDGCAHLCPAHDGDDDFYANGCAPGEDDDSDDVGPGDDGDDDDEKDDLRSLFLASSHHKAFRSKLIKTDCQFRFMFSS